MHVHRSHDAVVVVPGVMGSILQETTSREVLWGFEDLRAFRRALFSDSWIREITDLTPGRVKPVGLLRGPAWAPLGFFKRYGKLVGRLREVAHERAVLEFAYDWRLSVRHNARELARAAHAHLLQWREDPAHERLRAFSGDLSPARLVIVAHSMGGLLVRALPLVGGTEGEDGAVPDVTKSIRTTVTLGTPFRGAAKAALMMSGTHGIYRRLGHLSRALPGIYDLLPSYRCVIEGDRIRALTVEDVAGFGGDSVQAQRAFDFREQLESAALAGHRLIVGVDQPTVTCVQLKGGKAKRVGHVFRMLDEGQRVVYEWDGTPATFPSIGDGTVPVASASLEGVVDEPRAHQHGSLAQVDEVLTAVEWAVTGELQRAGLGERGNLGVDSPDVVRVGSEWPVVVTGDGARGATCRVVDAETGEHLPPPRAEDQDGRRQFLVTVPEAHFYEIVVDGGSGSPVRRMALATSGGDDE